MRKRQLKLLEKAQKRGFSEPQISLLSRDDLTIQELEAISSYFCCKQEVADRDLRVSEAEKCITFLKERRGEIADADVYRWLLLTFFPRCYNDIDPLMGGNRKSHIYRMYQFLIRSTKREEDPQMVLYVLSAYAYMLSYDFPIWHANGMKQYIQALLLDYTMADTPITT